MPLPWASLSAAIRSLAPLRLATLGRSKATACVAPSVQPLLLPPFEPRTCFGDSVYSTRRPRRPTPASAGHVNGRAKKQKAGTSRPSLVFPTLTPLRWMQTSDTRTKTTLDVYKSENVGSPEGKAHQANSHGDCVAAFFFLYNRTPCQCRTLA